MQLEIKNFRCFSSAKFQSDGKKIIVIGKNGAGKTTFFEALHYLCYLKSFRTHKVQELVAFNKENFFIKFSFTDSASNKHALQVGYSPEKRIVKLDKKPVGSYKDLLGFYRVVSLIDDDLLLIKGAPENRRTFLNKALFLVDSEYLFLLKKYKKIVENRNAILRADKFDKEAYLLWTEQLFNINKTIVLMRKKWISQLEKEVIKIVKKFFSCETVVTFSYSEKKTTTKFDTYQNFIGSTEFKELFRKEFALKRTLFGAHTDDVHFYFHDKTARNFASRGQQKLFVLLIKVAQIKMLQDFSGILLFLLDDFMSDFDNNYIDQIMKMLNMLQCYKLFSSPLMANDIKKKKIFSDSAEIITIESMIQ